MLDYRTLQSDADRLQGRVAEITAQAEPTAVERDEVMTLMGQIRTIEDIASRMREAEIDELRDVVARGNAIGAAHQGDPHAAEMDAFRAYLRQGTPMDASMSTTDANGGYIVPEPSHAAMIEKVRLVDPIFGNATMFPMSGDTTLLLPYKSAHGVVANATETGARSEQNAPTLTSPTLVCYDYYSDQRATQQFLDSVAGAEDMLMGWMYADIQEQAGADAVSGSGSTKIKGLFSETSAYTHVASGHADDILNTSFLTAYFALPVKYRSNAKWIMAPSTLAIAAAFADPASASIKLAQQSAGGQWTIYGKPVLESDSAPTSSVAGHFPVAFADIAAAYAVGVHRNTTILRDPYTAVPKIRFYSLARLGGCAWDYQACILIESAAS